MDKELITYLQQMEERMEKRMDARFVRVDEQFVQVNEQMDGRFAQVNEQMDGRFAEAGQGFQSLHEEVVTFRKQTAQGFEEVKDDIRGAHVSIEGLRSEVRLVAEGVANANESLERYKDEVSRDFKQADARHRDAYQNLEGRV
ncbi:MAG TPA: hypothetical protein VG477_07595, partial [Thermoanaerobaculia bacterium]|nr:hypothetical protein [Thermoanaerobaculia bacterium]